jgi:hypothetical protein
MLTSLLACLTGHGTGSLLRKTYHTHAATALVATLARRSRLVFTGLYYSMDDQSSRKSPRSSVFGEASPLGCLSVPLAVDHTASAASATAGPKPSNTQSVVGSCFAAQSFGITAASTVHAYVMPDNPEQVLLGANLPLPGIKSG